MIGRRIIVDGRARDVIGVMPESFRFMNFVPALIMPFQLNRGETVVGNFSYQAVARLRAPNNHRSSQCGRCAHARARARKVPAGPE